MFCPITSSKLSCQKFEFSLKVKVMGLNPSYLLKYFLLYRIGTKHYQLGFSIQGHSQIGVKLRSNPVSFKLGVKIEFKSHSIGYQVRVKSWVKWVNSGSIWVKMRSIWGQFWIKFKSRRGQVRVKLGSILDQDGVKSGSFLGQYWST